MTIKKIHYISGLTITIFIGLHLFNHFCSILGADKHIEIMTTLRHFYRNIFVETILLLAVVAQIYSGLKLFRTKRKLAKTFFEKLQYSSMFIIWSLISLNLFLIVIRITQILTIMSAFCPKWQFMCVMRQDEITVRVTLARGAASATVWTCDLSHDYVTINADYRS